ncbi:MAG: phospholipase [Pseudomonadota bacterium]|nr:phospholipase [Pseudomonadota bacterium]
MSLLARAAAFAALAWVAGPASAWNNHALGTWPALAPMAELKALAPVAAESLQSFLAADGRGIAAVLTQEEAWARRNVPTYPPRPGALAFRSEGASGDLLARFVAATRINPRARFALYLQLAPGAERNGRLRLPASAVTTFEHSESSRLDTFVALLEGEPVPVIDVIASASDEPDYGLDIGLWNDDATAFGNAYGFGKQPFGNPAVAFSSQAPMHMGFFHEAKIVYAAAPFLRRTYPEYRVHLWRSLAAEAFRSGHPYWGWRFAGWALHYVQDLTQPYHARVLPGAGTLRMMWINALDLAGMHTAKDRVVALVTNRHLALENYQLHWLYQALLRKNMNDAALTALRSGAEAAQPYTDASLRQTISRQSYEAADTIDAALVAALPPRYTSDPAYIVGVTEPDLDLYAAMAKAGPSARAALERAMLPLLGHFGAYSRSFIRAVLQTSR